MLREGAACMAATAWQFYHRAVLSEWFPWLGEAAALQLHDLCMQLLDVQIHVHVENSV